MLRVPYIAQLFDNTQYTLSTLSALRSFLRDQTYVRKFCNGTQAAARSKHIVMDHGSFVSKTTVSLAITPTSSGEEYARDHMQRPECLPEQ